MCGKLLVASPRRGARFARAWFERASRAKRCDSLIWGVLVIWGVLMIWVVFVFRDVFVIWGVWMILMNGMICEISIMYTMYTI